MESFTLEKKKKKENVINKLYVNAGLFFFINMELRFGFIHEFKLYLCMLNGKIYVGVPPVWFTNKVALLHSRFERI